MFRAAFAAFALLAVVAMVWAGTARDDDEKACAELGGVAVKSHLGPLVCIKESALLEVE